MSLVEPDPSGEDENEVSEENSDTEDVADTEDTDAEDTDAEDTDAEDTDAEVVSGGVGPQTSLDSGLFWLS